MKEYKNPICMRLDHLYCPLPLALEPYWNCAADCYYCIARRLNKIWGTEQRVANPQNVKQRLVNALGNAHPRSPLTRALSKKKTIFIGRKADPYQPLESKKHVTRKVIKILNELDWSYVICSRYTEHMQVDKELFMQGKVTLLIEITPGGENDWVLFERKRTTPIENRLRAAAKWQRAGISVGIRGEPFIPGHHTTGQFRDMLRRLKNYGLHSYNTYNLHLNAHNARRLAEIGLDIEKVWHYNQDNSWRRIQQELCTIADEEGITLGCPDFVNVPKKWRSLTNTCCGISVPRPFYFNTHFWRRLLQKNKIPKQVLKETWEGIGTESDYQQAKTIIYGTSKTKYTMRDAKS